MQALLREPLAHFAGLAALIFIAFQAVGGESEPGGERVLRLSAAEVARLATIYKAESGAAPDAEELRRILADHVETAALAAEARRLGLDAGDAVVERRLAQKMRFTLSDTGEIAPPEEAALRAWVAENKARFARPARYSFDQVYFKNAEDPRLQEAQGKLRSAPDQWRALGDPFMLSRQVGDLPLREIARRYGGAFAERIGAMQAGDAWIGPIPSAFGAHLIRITGKIKGAQPPFEAVRGRAQAMWIEEERRKRLAGSVAALVARYRVEIAAPPADVSQ